jgi:hypothetical protein
MPPLAYRTVLKSSVIVVPRIVPGVLRDVIGALRSAPCGIE